MTKCEELKFDLPLYFDGSLNSKERSAVDAHLPGCPLCRQKLSEFKDLFVGLREVPRYAAPDALVDGIRTAVAAQFVPSPGSPVFGLIDRRRRWTEIWLVPSFAGAASSLVIGLTLLSFMFSATDLRR